MRRLPLLLTLLAACHGTAAVRATDPGPAADPGAQVGPDAAAAPDLPAEAAGPDVPPEAEGPDGSEPDAVDPAPDAASPQVRLLKGPYLQAVTPTSVHVKVEVDRPPVEGASVRVSLPHVGAQETIHPIGFAEFLTSILPPGTWLGVAVLDGLQPATDYVYCVRVGTVPEVCDGFRTAPPDLAAVPFRFLAYGDTRTDHAAHQAVVDRMVATTPRAAFVIQTGDLDEFGDDIADWQVFFDIEARLLRFAPYYPLVGNHEGFLVGLEYYQQFFDLPAPLGDELDYSFTYGRAAFIALDTQVDVTQGALRDWLEGELARFRDAGYVVFVLTHEPMYSFALHGEYWAGPDRLTPLFEHYGVAAVLSGHNHLYEHFLANGIHYFTLGGGGAPLYDPHTHVVREQVPLEVMSVKAHHHAVFDVMPDRVDVTVMNDDTGAVIERLTLH